MSSKTTCKEQCTKCKCIVKEREIPQKKKQDCGGDQVPCVEAFRDLGECLQKAIVLATKTAAASSNKSDDCC